MKALSELKRRRDDIDFVFCDIDDTLTSAGKLEADAFSALWALRAAQKRVICVTGRPAGWCDAIVRQWPVSGVIGENGAFSMVEKDTGVEVDHHPQTVARDVLPERFAAIWADVQKTVPDARISKDQDFRWYDFAIDFAEDEPRLDLRAAEEILRVFEKHKAQAKISSIHVNGWFGAYDKRSMTTRFAQRHLGLDESALWARSVFVGDSPNDAPMFDAFPYSVGVANVLKMREQLEFAPKYVCENEGGRGFAELAALLLAK